MLSLRLNSIKNFINRTDKVMDVGCDHGLLGIALVKEHILTEVIVSDISPKALNNARENILKYNLISQVFPKLGDGLEIIESDINTITISGMGTHTILDILNSDNLAQVNKLVICSNNDYYLLRKKVCKKGFYIKDEKVIFENNKYYNTILFKRGYKRYNHLELKYGPILITKKNNKKYFEYLIHDYTKILELVPKKRITTIIKIKYNLYLLNKIIKSLNV